MKVEKKTPIEWCAENNLPGIIEILLKYGADIMITNSDSFGNSLHLACFKGNIESIDLLLASGVKLTDQNANEDTPLHVCAF